MTHENAFSVSLVGNLTKALTAFAILQKVTHRRRLLEFRERGLKRLYRVELLDDGQILQTKVDNKEVNDDAESLYSVFAFIDSDSVLNGARNESESVYDDDFLMVDRSMRDRSRIMRRSVSVDDMKRLLGGCGDAGRVTESCESSVFSGNDQSVMSDISISGPEKVLDNIPEKVLEDIPQTTAVKKRSNSSIMDFFKKIKRNGDSGKLSRHNSSGTPKTVAKSPGPMGTARTIRSLAALGLRPLASKCTLHPLTFSSRTHYPKCSTAPILPA